MEKRVKVVQQDLEAREGRDEDVEIEDDQGGKVCGLADVL